MYPVSYTHLRFVNESAKTVVECTYDSMGRKFEKKVTVGGTTGFHARYLYRDYLQVAECDLTGEPPKLVRSYLWDPSAPEAPRVLAMTLSLIHIDVYKRQAMSMTSAITA